MLKTVESGFGRVEMWRGGFRLGLSVSAPFVWRCLMAVPWLSWPALPHQTVRAVFPHTAFRCSSSQGMRPLPTRCRRHLVESMLFIQIPARKPDIPRLPISDLVTLSQVSPQPFLKVRPHLEHPFATIAEMKIFHPATNTTVDFPNKMIQRY